LQPAESVCMWLYGNSHSEFVSHSCYMMTNKGMLAREFSYAIGPLWGKKLVMAH